MTIPRKGRRRRLARGQPDPPPGFMWWHGELKRIVDVERWCRAMIGKHDHRPRAQRDRDNGIVQRFRLSKDTPNDWQEVQACGPLGGPKQTWPSASHMSAFGGKADIALGSSPLGFDPREEAQTWHPR